MIQQDVCLGIRTVEPSGCAMQRMGCIPTAEHALTTRHRGAQDQDPRAAHVQPHTVTSLHQWLFPCSHQVLMVTAADPSLLCTEECVSEGVAAVIRPGAAVAIEMGDYEHKGLADSLDLIKV